MEVTPTRSDDSFASERSAFMVSEENEAQRPTNPRKNIWWSLGKSIVQGFCKPKRNVFTTDEDEDEENDGEWNDVSTSSEFPSITTLVTRQHSSSDYYYGSTQSMLEIWIAACVLLGWTIRVLQYKDTSLALTTAVANKF